MTNYDAGITMDAFPTLPIYQGCMVKMASILLSHPIDLIRINIEANVLRVKQLTVRHMLKSISRHGLPGFYQGVLTSLSRCSVESLCSYHLFLNIHELVYQHPYYRMLKPYNIEFLKAFCSLGAGIVATPFAKLSVIRQADLTRGSFQRRNYGALASGLRCMFLKGGLYYLFIGWEMNAVSCAVMTGLQLPVNYYVEGMVSLGFNKENSWVPQLACMMLTGSIINVIMTPIDTLAVMALNNNRYSNFTYRTICQLVLKKHGYRGFFLGLKPGLISLIPNTALITVVTRLLLNEKPPETPPDKRATSSHPTGR